MGKKEELQIRQQKDFLEAVLNAQQEMICRFLPDTTLIFVNQAYCRYMGQPEEKLLGTKWLSFIPQQNQETILKHLAHIAKTSKIINYQHEVLMPNGRKTWQQWTDIPIFDKSGELQEFQSVGIDITQQKNAELLLEAERLKLNSILKTIDHAVWTAETNPFRLTLISDPITQITGYNPEEFVTDPALILKMVHESDHDKIRADFRKVYEEGFFSTEIKIIPKKGQERFIQYKAWLIKDIENGKTRIEGIASDVSDRRKYEEKLIALNQSKDRIMATVAHDLRNPISGILGLCNMLEQKNPASENLFYIDLIRRSSQTALGIMEELLEVSEMETENYQLTKQKVCLNDLIMEVLEHFKTDALEKQIDLSADIPEKRLFADLNLKKFSRVLENLISNALKFTGEKGKVRLSLEEKAENVLIMVKDTGIGIPKELQHFLFEKFSRAKRFGLKGEKTHGLGMYITKQIVEMHGGTISFQSKEHKGTSFFIQLQKSA
ncbi:MAG: PAS domain-containing sensor histidine kinase [Bacteroidales bacterium]|nr:PAS domain-containing sensor histidine kinase [Bacteroidales bacterium]